jgi:hypothetical protein
MSKRCRSVEPTDPPLTKRQRFAEAPRTDNLSRLSDEIILQIFSFLPIRDLVLCQR